MFDHDSLSPQAFLQRLDSLLGDPAGRLIVPAASLVALLDPKQVQEFVAKRLGERPSLVKHLATLMTLPGGRLSDRRHG